MTAIHIALTVTIYCEPKMRKIIFTKFVLIFFPLDGALKIAIFKKEAVYLRCVSYFAEKKRCQGILQSFKL